MKEIPETMYDVVEILLNQLALIKQESTSCPKELPELTDALCEVVATLQSIRFCGHN